MSKPVIISRARLHAMADQFLAAAPADLGLFAYGSLIWSPEFRPAFRLPARIHGYSRRGCVYSFQTRGTASRPGLVFGLDSGGSCTGVVLGLPAEAARKTQVMRRLFVREMFMDSYTPRIVTAHADGTSHACLTFVANRESPCYAAPMPAERQRRMVMTASGERGACIDYWRSTTAFLHQQGFRWQPDFDLADG